MRFVFDPIGWRAAGDGLRGPAPLKLSLIIVFSHVIRAVVFCAAPLFFHRDPELIHYVTRNDVPVLNRGQLCLWTIAMSRYRRHIRAGGAAYRRPKSETPRRRHECLHYLS